MNQMCDAFMKVLDKNKKFLLENEDKETEKMEHLLGMTLISIIGGYSGIATNPNSLRVSMTHNIVEYINRVSKIVHDNLRQRDQLV